MKKFIVSACAIALAAAWSGVPAFAADDTTPKESMKDKVKDKMDTAKDKVGSAVDKTKEKAAEVKDKVKEKMTGKRGSDNVRTAQQTLQDKGFNPGPIDGRMGPQTKAAITDFQKKENLKVNGRLDKETKDRLGMTASMSSTSSPAAPSASPSTPASGPSTPPATTGPASDVNPTPKKQNP
jgi:peptidoglycan hydrolase-like protein with peptidoglycan-binding domain